MKKPGRNDPWPCGSGLKYKKCCLAKAQAALRFTREDRQSALAKLDRFSGEVVAREDDEAFDEFWGEQMDGDDELGEHWNQVSEQAFDMWFGLDRPLDDGQLVVDRLLAEDPSITAGERQFLELARATSMRLYEVVDARPGLSLTLRDALDGTEVTVHEKMGSRQIKRADLLVARVI